MDTVEVTAHFDTQGRITPITFVRGSRPYNVEGTGRRWRAKDETHILVMAAGNRVFHLIFYSASGIWKLVPRIEPLREPQI